MMLIRPNIGIKYAYHLFLGLDYTPTQLVGIESTSGFLDQGGDTTISTLVTIRRLVPQWISTSRFYPVLNLTNNAAQCVVSSDICTLTDGEKQQIKILRVLY